MGDEGAAPDWVWIRGREGRESSGVFGASVSSVRMDTRLRSFLSEVRAAYRELRDDLLNYPT